MPVFSALILVAGITYAVWTEPTAVPPNNNVEAPINVGAIEQTKSGKLNALDFCLKDNLSHCLSNLSTSITLSVLGAEGWEGYTGESACASQGKVCVKVISTNFIKVDAACPSATHCLRVCSSWYNTGLPGVTQGGDHDNIHDCVAPLGEQCTYLHPGVVQCDAWFYAVCN